MRLRRIYKYLESIPTFYSPSSSGAGFLKNTYSENGRIREVDIFKSLSSKVSTGISTMIYP